MAKAICNQNKWLNWGYVIWQIRNRDCVTEFIFCGESLAAQHWKTVSHDFPTYTLQSMKFEHSILKITGKLDQRECIRIYVVLCVDFSVLYCKYMSKWACVFPCGCVCVCMLYITSDSRWWFCSLSLICRFKYSANVVRFGCANAVWIGKLQCAMGTYIAADLEKQKQQHDDRSETLQMECIHWQFTSSLLCA